MDRVVVSVCVVLACCIPVSRTCPVQPGVSVERISQILDEAKRRNGSGTMFLEGFGRGPSTKRFLVAEWPPNTAIMRAPESGTLLILCNTSHNTNNMQVSHIEIPPAFTYNGIQVAVPTLGIFREPHDDVNYCCNCSRKFSPGEIVPRRWLVPEYNLASGAFSIALENFSYVYTGLYECLRSNGSQLVVTQRYWVSATLFRHNVFHPPMKNLSVRYGDPAEMVCAVRFNFLPGYLKTRFLWRRESYLLMAKSIQQVADKTRAWWDFKGIFHFGVVDQCRCNSTMRIDSVTWKDAGPYECWFRINDRLDEWILQEAYLHVI
ncbi:uncharacterized protein LOC129595125 [Paramacrobiotus metropolitanus]|uniref:uncharacterized protein LOC129595125 n=1 Tax=Paramacrobiotus metropolitanus TaxID=2943436 RepID=UPI002445B520|nr:uncharacterized protein LOC129595125 [Paramacrobiotus metropolitanus]